MTRHLHAWILALALIAPLAAHAQRTAENPLSSAQDAFGTQVGNETIGLYRDNNARGFSPTDAGNTRFDGLYFDRQGMLPNRLIRSTTIRVGIAAQSYPFVAPTGVADYHLRLPGDTPSVSLLTRYGTYASINQEIDAVTPVVENKFSLGYGVNFGKNQRGVSSGDSYNWAGAVLGHIRPTDSIEIIPFFSYEAGYDQETTPRIYMGVAQLPPKTDRRVFWGQRWLDFTPRTMQTGGIARAAWDGWLVQAGLFRSVNKQLENNLTLIRNTQVTGIGDRTFFGFPTQIGASTSGEFRVSRFINEGDRRHVFHASFFGRDVDRVFGGAASVPDGPTRIGVPNYVPEVIFNYPRTSDDNVLQGNFGLSYGLQWKGIGDVSIGMQKTLYYRTVNNPNRPSFSTNSYPILYNGTATFYLTDWMALYGSYTRGLEDGGQAPDRATNFGQSAPATITRQADAGFRFTLSPNFKVVAGAFQIVKPLWDIDFANFFTNIGDVTHEGFEFSASGQVTDDLTIIGGAVLLYPRISGPLADAGGIGKIPPNKSKWSLRTNVQYNVPVVPGLMLDTQASYDSPQYTDFTNTLAVNPLTTIDVGVRYRFALYDAPAMLRLQVFNVFNAYEWTVGFSRALVPVEPRRYALQFTVDL